MRIGSIFFTPQGGILWYSYSLTKPRINNEIEYEALITALELAIDMNIQKLHVYGNSQLIIWQTIGVFKINKPELVLYHKHALELPKQILDMTITRVLYCKNDKADVLAKLAKEMADP